MPGVNSYDSSDLRRWGLVGVIEKRAAACVWLFTFVVAVWLVAESPLQAQAPAAWIGTVTVTESQRNTDPLNTLTYTFATTYALEAGATGTGQTTFSADYYYLNDVSARIPVLTLMSRQDNSGTGAGTGGSFSVSYDTAQAGYFISAGPLSSATFTLTRIATRFYPPPTMVSTSSQAWLGYSGTARVASPQDTLWVLRGSQDSRSAPADYCQGTFCFSTEVTYNLRRADCQGAPDSDGDGLNVCQEFDLGTNPDNADTDGDGFLDGIDRCPLAIGPLNGCPDRCGNADLDVDGDGRTNEAEGCVTLSSGTDTDGDGIPDFLDSDSDNDGRPDSAEGDGDGDGDGIPDWRDPDVPPAQQAVWERYAPLVFFHPSEDRFPMDPGIFASNSPLKWSTVADPRKTTFPNGQLIGCPDPVVYQDFNVFRLARTGFWYDETYCWGPLTRSTGRTFSTARHLTAPAAADNPFHINGFRRGFFLDLDNSRRDGNRPSTPPGTQYREGPPLYYEYKPGRYIVYWFFYGFNDRVGDAHEGDWEKIVVKLNSRDEPEGVAFYQHYCKPVDDEKATFGYYAWNVMEFTGRLSGTHPIVYSARGGHASFSGTLTTPDFEAIELDGEYAVYTPCSIINPFGRGAYDRMKPGGRYWPTWQASPTAPQPLVDATTQPWYGFGGGWGAHGNTSIPGAGWGPLGPGGVMWRTAPPVPTAWLDEWSDIDKAPRWLSASEDGGNVQLAWSPPNAATASSYVIEAGTYPGGTDLAVFDTGNSINSLTVPSVPPGTYYLRVRAKSNGQTSLPSREAKLDFGQCLFPGEVGFVTYSQVGASVALGWTIAQRGFTYSVLVGAAPGRTDREVLVGRSLTLAGSPPPGTYYVRIKATNSCGYSLSDEYEITVR